MAASMYFLDFLGSQARYEQVRPAVVAAVAAVMRVAAEQVRLRRVVVEESAGAPGQGAEESVEIWVELSSEEQLYRYGQALAARISEAVRGSDGNGPEVWVMYRVVPLNRAFLNGQPRGRGTASFD